MPDEPLQLYMWCTAASSAICQAACNSSPCVYHATVLQPIVVGHVHTMMARLRSHVGAATPELKCMWARDLRQHFDERTKLQHNLHWLTIDFDTDARGIQVGSNVVWPERVQNPIEQRGGANRQLSNRVGANRQKVEPRLLAAQQRSACPAQWLAMWLRSCSRESEHRSPANLWDRRSTQCHPRAKERRTRVWCSTPLDCVSHLR